MAGVLDSLTLGRLTIVVKYSIGQLTSQGENVIVQTSQLRWFSLFASVSTRTDELAFTTLDRFDFLVLELPTPSMAETLPK